MALRRRLVSIFLLFPSSFCSTHKCTIMASNLKKPYFTDFIHVRASILHPYYQFHIFICPESREHYFFAFILQISDILVKLISGEMTYVNSISVLMRYMKGKKFLRRCSIVTEITVPRMFWGVCMHSNMFDTAERLWKSRNILK